MKKRGNKRWNSLVRWFDRSFSSGWGRQVLFLGGVLLFFIVIGTVLMACSLARKSGHLCIFNYDALIRTVELLLDPGSFGNRTSDDFSVGLQLFITLAGAVVFTAMLITVIGNIVSHRIDNYKKGRVRYNFDDHILVLGANSMLISMLKEFIRTGVHQRRKIVVLTTQDTEKLHDKIVSDIPDLDDRLDVTWLNGSRIIAPTLRNVQIDEAYSIYILGEDNEIDHDSINMECWHMVKELCKDVRRPVQCYLVVDRVSTYHVLQFGCKEKDSWLYLNIINSLENWAQRVLVSREYLSDVCSGESGRYRAIDREGIGADSEKTVRFVIYGMNQMSYAMASTVAHIAHFPNFKDGRNRTKICFIAPDIRQEMDFFLGHYQNLFLLSHAKYISWNADGKIVEKIERTPDPDYGDFLDVEWEFVSGSIESEQVRSLLAEWSENDNEYLSLAICESESDANLAASLYLPEIIYSKDIPVFVYQPLSGEVLKYAHDTVRYDNVYPFGMKDECYDPLFRKRIVKAKRINYLYQLQRNLIPYEGMASQEILEEYWNTRLEYIYKLSNLYAANAIPIKMRSVGIDPDKIDDSTVLSQNDIDILAEVEHNRWNMERLLSGTMPVKTDERKKINAMLTDSDESVMKEGKRIKDQLQANFYHKDIAPYSELLEASKKYDRAIVTNIPDVMKNV